MIGEGELRSRVAAWGTGAGSEEEEAEKRIEITGGNGNSTDSSRVMGQETTGQEEPCTCSWSDEELLESFPDKDFSSWT